MVIFCCGGCGGGAGCARPVPAAPARMIALIVARMERSAMRERRSRIALRSMRATKCGCSLIDHHAPGNAAYRDRDRRLAALHVDDGDVVAEAVGDKELALVLGERDAPGALADQDIGLDLAGRH